MYAEGFTVSRILAACDMSLGTLYYWLGGGPRDETGAPLLPPLARRRVVVGKRRKPFAASRVSLLARLYRTAERQVFDIEQRLAVPGEATPERERDVRMLASLTRTLRDLSGLGDGEPAPESVAAEEKAQAQEAKAKETAETDQMRLDLARRITGFVEARQEARRDQQEAAQDQRPSIAKS